VQSRIPLGLVVFAIRQQWAEGAEKLGVRQAPPEAAANRRGGAEAAGLSHARNLGQRVDRSTSGALEAGVRPFGTGTAQQISEAVQSVAWVDRAFG